MRTRDLDLVFRLSLALSPLFLTVLSRTTDLSIPDLAFSPQGIIYEHRLLPLFFSPWTKAEPGAITITALKLLESGAFLFLYLTEISNVLPVCYGLYVITAGVRTLMGFILTRSVGWMYPSWFYHWALYEKTGGFGVGLGIYLVLRLDFKPRDDREEVDSNDSTVNRAVSLSHRYRTPLTLLPVTLLYWLEDRPWTYTAGSIVLLALYPIVFLIRRWTRDSRGSYAVLPEYEVSKERKDEPGEEKGGVERSWKVAARRWLALTLFALVNGTAHRLLCPHLEVRLPMPDTPQDRPLLDILILTFPRRGDADLSADLLNTTLGSFITHVEPDRISLSVFTHAQDHEGMDRVEQEYRGTEGVEFYTDRDEHEEDEWGHYLHLSEAFRWANRDADDSGIRRRRRAEWIMLVEDDFPVCEGGWEVVETVMNRLEMSRERGVVRSGFVGTGGSGLFIHHTYLPLLIRLLRDYSTLTTPFPSEVHRFNPDEIMHECLLGAKGHICERQTSAFVTDDGEEKGMIISSRLVLDHIGGMATTADWKRLNSDRWRCGWRHPFHGRGGVEVVVV